MTTIIAPYGILTISQIAAEKLRRLALKLERTANSQSKGSNLKCYSKNDRPLNCLFLVPFTNVSIACSWHIHYTTNTTDQERFYYAFIDAFSKYFPPASAGNLCPFGPNFGRFSYEYVCSLENAMEEAWTGKLALDFEEAHGAAANPRFSPLRSSRALGQDVAGSSTTQTAGPDTSIVGDNPWGNLPQRAFFVPLSVIDEAWAWSRQPINHGYVDLLLHPNTGCMHDDHSLRNTWDLAESDSDEPTIDVSDACASRARVHPSIPTTGAHFCVLSLFFCVFASLCMSCGMCASWCCSLVTFFSPPPTLFCDAYTHTQLDARIPMQYASHGLQRQQFFWRTVLWMRD